MHGVKKGTWAEFFKRLKHMFSGGAFFCLYMKLLLALLQLPSLEGTLWLIPFSEVVERSQSHEISFEQAGGGAKMNAAIDTWTRKVQLFIGLSRPY